MAVAGAPGAGTGHGGAGDLLGHLRLEPGAGRSGRSANGSRTPSARQLGSRAYLLMNFTGGCWVCSASPRWPRGAAGDSHSPSIMWGPRSWRRSTFLAPATYTQALWLLPLMAFFVLGMHAGYAIYFPELFPTRLRATGSSVCFNWAACWGP